MDTVVAHRHGAARTIGVRRERRFTAMGTEAHVVVYGDDAPGLLDHAQGRVERLEARWSRFRPTSEISRLNAADGVPTIVSDDTRLLVQRMLAGRDVTSGAFDPTVLHDLESLGYDRDFSEVGAVVARCAPGRSCTTGRGVVVSPDSNLVWLQAGVGIDAGGIGKGLAADIVAGELLARGATGALVNLGGDLRVCGAPSDASAWLLEVRDPFTDERADVVEIVDGALATSSAWRRRWTRDTDEVHHLIDPATHTSTRGIAGASVIAGEAWQAEVLTKAIFVDGVELGLASVARLGAAARVVLDNHEVVVTDSWRQFETGCVR